jgi:DNA-binding PadR family transcriptional regulator
MGHHWHGGAWGAGPWGSPPPWAEFMRGFGTFRDPRSRGGPKVRRGDVRLAIIDVLAAEPMNGYQVIQEIARRSGGEWKPSPGSVYPTLQQLQDEGLIAERGEGGSRRRFELTDEGHGYVEEHLSELAETWRAFEEPDSGIDSNDLRPVIGQVMGACWQVACSGTMPQQERAFEILSETKSKLYRLLAEGGTR